MSIGTKIIQSGDGSEFNSSLSTLERMHNLMMAANQASFYDSIEATQAWLDSLRALDRELSPYCNDDDETMLDNVRIKNIIIARKEKLLHSIRNRLDKYERALRKIHSEKGFGIKAKDDAGSAARRAARG